MSFPPNLSFFVSLGSIMGIVGNYFEHDLWGDTETDCRTMLSDWEAVGEDMKSCWTEAPFSQEY